MIPPLDPAVAKVFASFPPAIRRRTMALRRLILETAATTDGVGPITETLKWGEPAYLTSASKSGTTVRIGWKKATPERYALHVHCQTNLIEPFRALFPEDFNFDGNRAIVFEESDDVPADSLAIFIAAALTYHRAKKSRPRT